MDPFFGNFDKEQADRLSRVQNLPGVVRANAAFLNEVAVSMLKENFENAKAGDGPKWKPLSDTTLDRRRQGKRIGGGSPKILIDTGILFNSSAAASRGTKTIIGYGRRYGGAHQFGVDKKTKRRVPAGQVKAHTVKARTVKAHTVKAHTRKAYTRKDGRTVKAHDVKAHDVKAHNVKAHKVKAHNRKAYTQDVHLKIPARPQDWTAVAVDRMLARLLDYTFDGSV